MAILHWVMRGRRIGDYANVKVAKLRFDGPSLYAGDIFLMNVGRVESRETILEHGVGAIIDPKDPNAATTLASIGQRQALVHDVASILGIRRDLDEPEFTPIARLDHDSGRTGMVIVPLANDPLALKDAVQRVPIIESIKRRPLAAKSGRRAFGVADGDEDAGEGGR